jgi:hypothetical protein
MVGEDEDKDKGSLYSGSEPATSSWCGASVSRLFPGLQLPPSFPPLVPAVGPVCPGSSQGSSPHFQFSNLGPQAPRKTGSLRICIHPVLFDAWGSWNVSLGGHSRLSGQLPAAFLPSPPASQVQPQGARRFLIRSPFPKCSLGLPSDPHLQPRPSHELPITRQAQINTFGLRTGILGTLGPDGGLRGVSHLERCAKVAPLNREEARVEAGTPH